MNVFVLCTGRCGSVTFAKACSHITNYTSGHETRASVAGPLRLHYKPNHIEVDNRLCWFLGTLHKCYPDAYYVHLTRRRSQVVASFDRRKGSSILRAFGAGIIMRGKVYNRTQTALDYVGTVVDNIEHFLRDKPHMHFQIEKANELWPSFCDRIGAKCNISRAGAEFSVRHNAST